MCVFILLKVLGNGEVIEYDTPSVLLSNSNSYFVSMVEQTGPAEAEHLRILANRTTLKMNEKNQERTEDDELVSSENDPLLV
jgi:ABC-type proline/glycine betaine transport system ATPase subunit